MKTEIKPQAKGTKQLFENPILEKLSRTHISIPLIIFFGYSFALLYWNFKNTNLSITITALFFIAGLISFTWVEYMVHRHLFHMETYTKVREKIQYTMHGVHHEYPKDKDRLAMPPLLSITIATILLLVFRILIGNFVFAFLPGFLIGYALYLFIHYIVHAYPPPKNFFKALWVNHSVHHYKDGEIVFGVSSPLWDYVYGTMKFKEPKKAA
jgi:sterol desaturase/sphingolipid hydroxylase (fatty acid hydroxylase superfamily)